MRYTAPPLWKVASEVRAPAEFVSLLASAPWGRSLPRGDGHTVLVIPGFMAPDASTLPLRRVLRRLGYDAHGWGLGVNKGPRPAVVAGMRDLLASLAHRSDGGVSIIGWSLGGMYGRRLAREHPAAVRQLITLASPFRMDKGDRSTASRLYESLETPNERILWRPVDGLPLRTPVTAMVSKFDGIVDWRACIEDSRPEAETLVIRGASHIGLGHNPAVLAIVADRLAQPVGTWAPYDVPERLRRVVVPIDGVPVA